MESQLISGKDWLERLLALMGLAVNVNTEGFETVDTESNSSWLSIDGSSLSEAQKESLIGAKGESIDALQYLANTILNLSTDETNQSSFVIEFDGYRYRRNQELEALTQEVVAQVRTTGQEVEVPGLSSAERKQVHSLLQSMEDLKSESRGQEPNRRLVIIPN